MNALTPAENAAIVARAVLSVEVRNHPGVMSHVVGLFSRRAFNVEGIACLPVGDGCCSRIWLLVADDAGLPRMIRQLQKLEDVTGVSRHAGDHPVFDGMRRHFQPD
jgi:acetolactate synthase I/III small subunit